jgi:alkanesulfonate monooxygenase SsuD/methylene tetrahydromethanopterin reductase-like flavin-dependent oxidoreductase (luciferase family)
MRLGAIVLQTRPWSELAEDFRSIERIGYDVAYVADHLTHPTLPGRWLGDGFTTLGAAAVVTTTIELGTLVASAAYRTPVTLARAGATLADVTGGRLVLGLGAGSPHCAAADRAVHPTPREMTDRYADLVEGLREVWSGTSEWHGGSTGFEGLQTSPLPEGAAAPFLLLAAHGPRGFDLVARFGDGWSTYGGPAAVTLPSEDYWKVLTDQQAGIDAACARHDRDPDDLRRSLLLGFGVDRPTESVSAFSEAVDRAEAAGFDELVVYWPDGEPGSRMWSDPQVHADGVAAVRGARPLG